MKKLFVIGDSISMHYGPYLERYLNGKYAYDRKRAKIGEKSELDFPSGENGGDSSMVLCYLKTCKAILADVDILLINCGLHDIKRDPDTLKYQVDIKDYENNLNSILDILDEFDISVIWVRTTPVDERLHLEKKGRSFLRFEADVDKYNLAADDIMNKRGIRILDLFGFTENIRDELYTDGVHFKDEIRKLQAAFIAGYLANGP